MVKYSARGYSAKKWHDLESWKREKYQDMGRSVVAERVDTSTNHTKGEQFVNHS